MTKRVRLWGGPACGEVKDIPDYCEKVRIHVPEPLDIVAMSHPDYQMPRHVILSEFEYSPSNYCDSHGLHVYIPENIPLGRCITENFDRMSAEFYMNRSRPAKACIVPRPVWYDFEKELQRNMPVMWFDTRSSLDGKIMFKGIEIVFGDEFKMLIAPPSSPWPIPPDRPERDPEEVRRQYEGEWPTDYPRPFQFRGYGQPRRIIGVDGGTPDQNLRTPSTTITSRTRRNRTTIYSGDNTRCLFRIVFENGSKLTEERKGKLHRQYLQSIKNWGLQYVENSDLL